MEKRLEMKIEKKIMLKANLTTYKFEILESE